MLESEYVGLFGEADSNPEFKLEDAYPPEGGVILLVSDDGPVGVGGWRHYENGVAVLKKMYVHYVHRNQGLSRNLLNAIEYHAKFCGMRRMILDTATVQVAAIALYHSAGYDAIEPFGYYKDASDSLFFGKDL